MSKSYCSLFLCLCSIVCLAGCLQPRINYENVELRAQYEKEFASRSLDPIEGFWESKNEYAEGIGVIFKTEASGNGGFPFASKTMRWIHKVRMPHRFGDLSRVMARFKPSSRPGVYHGQTIMFKGNHEYWEDVTMTLLDATTAEWTIHSSGPVMGGKTQRGYLVGPREELDRRLASEKSATPSSPAPGTSVSGSGFLVARSLVVTNHHVVEGSPSRITCHINGESSSSKVVAHDPDNDLALLMIENNIGESVHTFVINGLDQVRQGERVYALGFPLPSVLGNDLKVHEGIVSSLKGFQGSSAQYQVEMSINPGNSGGPLINQSGQVVGVISSKLNSKLFLQQTDTIPEGVTFAVKSIMLRPLSASAGAMGDLTFAQREHAKMSLEEIVETVRSGVVRIEVEY